MTPSTEIQQPQRTPAQRLQVMEIAVETQRLIAALQVEFDIDADQIFVLENGKDLWFGVEALTTLANELGQFSAIAVDQAEYDTLRCFCTAKATVILPNGDVRSSFDTVAVGDYTITGKEIKTLRDAVAFAHAGALRRALRAAGFNPVKAFIQLRQGHTPTPEPPKETPWQTMNKEAHQHGWTLGYIFKIEGTNQVDKSRWYKQLQLLFPAARNSKDLTEQQMSRWVSTLRALVNANANQQ